MFIISIGVSLCCLQQIGLCCPYLVFVIAAASSSCLRDAGFCCSVFCAVLPRENSRGAVRLQLFCARESYRGAVRLQLCCAPGRAQRSCALLQLAVFRAVRVLAASKCVRSVARCVLRSAKPRSTTRELFLRLSRSCQRSIQGSVLLIRRRVRPDAFKKQHLLRAVWVVT